MSEEMQNQDQFYQNNIKHKQKPKKAIIAFIIILILGTVFALFNIFSSSNKSNNLYTKEIINTTNEMESILSKELNNTEKIMKQFNKNGSNHDKTLKSLKEVELNLFKIYIEAYTLDEIGKDILNKDEFFYTNKGIDYMAKKEYQINYEYLKDIFSSTENLVNKIDRVKGQLESGVVKGDDRIKLEKVSKEEQENLVDYKKEVKEKTKLMKKNKKEYSLKRKYYMNVEKNKSKAKNYEFYQTFAYDTFKADNILLEYICYLSVFDGKFGTFAEDPEAIQSTLGVMKQKTEDMKKHSNDIKKLKSLNASRNSNLDNLCKYLEEVTVSSYEFMASMNKIVEEKEVRAELSDIDEYEEISNEFFYDLAEKIVKYEDDLNYYKNQFTDIRFLFNRFN